MLHAHDEQRWLWTTLALSSITIVALVFSVWELVEHRFFSHSVDFATFHFMYITRGISSSLLLAFWAAWYVVRHRRRSDEELRRSRERYRGLLEASPGAIALCDTGMRVVEWNATAERLYGFERSEVLGRGLPTVPQRKYDELCSFIERVRSGESVLGEESVRLNKKGEAIEVQVSLLRYVEPGREDYFLEVTEDNRTRVRLRERLLEIEKLTTMGIMAAGTAHHLNTPLGAMLLRVQMMRERRTQDSLASDLERLEAGIVHCQHFVSRLLEFSRHYPARKQFIALGPLVQGVVHLLRPVMAAKQIQVSMDVGSVSELRVLADPNMLEAMFSIVVNNAIDAVEAGGNIAVCSGTPSAGWVAIQITDDGSGISPADLGRVFEPFFTTKGPEKGTGLGLAIARNIVLEHGGSIRLESTPGRGTTAFVELPCFESTRSDTGGKS